ncbi:MAG: DinB family protein [Actinomycetales bacterium]|nr:MAG: DinB family protein [Actinomycetales bacterium]
MLPEPSGTHPDTAGSLVRYLAFFRAEVRRKLDGLEPDALRTTVLPSGWTPLELLSHLVHMERRWFVWGFLGEPLPDPWGDQGPDGRWSTTDSPESLLARLEAGAARTESVLLEHPLDTRAALGGRFDADPPTLHAIGFHVLQEYARHAGHLDVVRELVDGAVGEDASA